MTLTAKILSLTIVPAALVAIAATAPAYADTVDSTGAGNVCTHENYLRYLSGNWPPQLMLHKCDWSRFQR